ncbi:hypothetical protein EDB84DRAFT_1587571 [Lactarius hengduanensis]|nr:hypothetical protein EDB84DRAFT_1587571 [Lactarius hengduanensis]
MNSVPLVLPFTLAASTSRSEGPPDASSCASILVDEASSVANVSSITYWLKNGQASPTSQQFASFDALDGVVLGCEDGTLYLLRQSPHHTPHPIGIEKPLSSRPSSPTSARFSRSRSRPRTPTSSLAPFSLTSRARVVSGISDEQAQAPKNYVDFDEEPDKLKELLRGRVRDSASGDRLPLSLDRTAAAEKQAGLSKGLSSPSGSVRRSEAKSLLSATHSPALSVATLPTPPSPSSPSSPSHLPYHLSLGCHIFPRRSGTGNPVVGLRALANHRHFVCLRSQGDLSMYAVKDGSCVWSSQISHLPAVAPTGAKEVQPSGAAWTWRGLFVHETGESVVILASAALCGGFASKSSEDDDDSTSQKQLSRVAVFELRDDTDKGDEELGLDKAGEWLVEGPTAGVGFCTDEHDVLKVFHVDTSNHLIVQRIVLVPAAIQLDSPDDNSSVGLATFNPFKTGGAQSQGRPASLDERREGCRILLEDFLDVGELKLDQRLRGIQLHSMRDCIRGAAWSDSELYAFEYDSKRLIMNSLGTTSEGLRDVTWLGWDMYCAVYSNRYEVSKLRLVDPNNDRVSDKRSPGILHSHVVSTAAVRGTQAFCALSPTAVLSTGISRQGRRRIELHTPIPSGESRKEWTRTILWKSHDKGSNVPGDKHITCMLPLELTHIVLGYSDGTIGRSSFAKLVHVNSQLAPEDVSDIPLDGFIVGLHIAQNDRTGERLIVGGADDGSVAIWSLESMKTLARWVLFISPLQRVLHLRHDKGGPLRGCLLCIAGDGTIAVIALDDYQFLYMVPGAPAPLIKVCTGGDNLLLLYGDDRARLWDVKTLEFWRSMNMEKAKELLNQGGWAELRCSCTVLTSMGRSLLDTPSAGSAHSTLSAFSPDSCTSHALLFTSRKINVLMRTRERTAGVLRSLLQILHTPGLNPDIDVICREQLVLPVTLASVGFHRNYASSVIVSENPQSQWCVSGEVSASRALALTACLRTLAHFEDLADCVNTVITFYATSLPHSVGRAYIPPSLSFLARWWFDVSGTVYDVYCRCFSTNSPLPFLLPDSERRSPVAAKALLLCGFIATRQYNLLSSSALNIISKSVMTYLHEERCMIRSLFNLATSSKKESITAQNIGPQARQAVLHVVTNNTGIFMTTLSLDILHPQSLEHRKSVLQLVAFLTRKKPLVIYPHLPKLVEAVVKSLDPNSTSNRDAVLDTATEILGHVVKTFPTIDFHTASQRLAVGTSEGAIVMYDLKTATRLYVLESHKQALAACSFSPDGRRLATVSLQEGVVLVWKVGTGFTSFFYPGAPPRQGHGGSEPFKSLNFNVGEAAVMSLEETFEHVHFEWTAERSVQLKIRDVTLTFST